MSSEIALATRARGLATHLLARETLEMLADAATVGALAHGLSRFAGAIEPPGHPPTAFTIERAAGRTAHRHLLTLYRWQQRTPGVLDLFAAYQDRRSLRALLRGAAEGASPETRLQGLLPTPSLPRLALVDIAHQASPADVVRQLTLIAHDDAPHLRPLVARAQMDLLAVDVTLLRGFTRRATRAAASDRAAEDLVSAIIDVGNLQNAILLSEAVRQVNPDDIFVHGGRWLPASAFTSAARIGSPQRTLANLATVLARSPLAAVLPVAVSDLAHLDRAFLVTALEWLRRAARLNPLGASPLLEVLFLIEAQTRDLRTLAWGAALATPPSLRRQQLVTPR